jgi:hypothetical protein
LGILNWTQTGKRTYTRTLCQKNGGTVKIEQKPATVGGGTVYRTPSPKRTPLQTGTLFSKGVKKKMNQPHTYPV